MISKKQLLLGVVLSVSSFAHSAVRTEQAFVATPIPGTHLTAVYGKLINDSDDTVHITRVTSDSSDAAELHAHSVDSDDISRMRRVERMVVPAHDVLVLSKGGQHLMLINLNKKLRDHDEVTLTLYFDKAEPQQITLPVLRSASQLDEHH